MKAGYGQPHDSASVCMHMYMSPYWCILPILDDWVHPSIANAYPLEVLGIERVALHNDLRRGWDIMASYMYIGGQERGRGERGR